MSRMNQQMTRQNNSEHTLDEMFPLGPPPRLERSPKLRIAPLEPIYTPYQEPSPLDAPPPLEQRAEFQSPKPKELDEVTKKLF